MTPEYTVQVFNFSGNQIVKFPTQLGTPLLDIDNALKALVSNGWKPISITSTTVHDLVSYAVLLEKVT